MSDQRQSFEQPVQRPWAKKIADKLRAAKDYDPLGLGNKDPVVNFLIGDKDKLFDRVAYGLPLTEGKIAGAARLPALVREAGEIPDLTPAKGVSAVTMLGKRGLDALGDSTRMARWMRTEDAISKAAPRDWFAQKEIVEGAGGIPIPHGRTPGDIATKPTIEHALPYYDTSKLDRRALHELRYGDPKQIKEFPLQQFFDDPIARKAYPRLDSTSLRYDPKRAVDSGSYNHEERMINMGPTSGEDAAERILYHEGNHLAQKIEGWPLGTNTETARRQLTSLASLRDDLQRQGAALPLELRRQRPLLDAWDKAQSAPRAERERTMRALAHRLYRNEAGEQGADAGSRAVRSPKSTSELWTADPREMYSERRLSQMLRDYGM